WSGENNRGSSRLAVGWGFGTAQCPTSCGSGQRRGQHTDNSSFQEPHPSVPFSCRVVVCLPYHSGRFLLNTVLAWSEGTLTKNGDSARSPWQSRQYPLPEQPHGCFSRRQRKIVEVHLQRRDLERPDPRAIRCDGVKDPFRRADPGRAFFHLGLERLASQCRDHLIITGIIRRPRA